MAVTLPSRLENRGTAFTAQENKDVHPKLISYKLCPYVQRVAIALKLKGIAHTIEYIDLANPPEWFAKLSPLAKVPLLLVEGHVLFESAVINEYLDETYPNKLHPSDLILRAKNRAWIEHGNSCMANLYQLSVKESEQDFNEVRDDLLAKFDPLEHALVGPGYFNGASFSLVDASYAPLLQRLEYIDEIKPGLFDSTRHPKICAWKNCLLELEAVRESCLPEIRTLYLELLWKRRGYISRFLDKTKYLDGIEQSIY